MPHLSVVKNLIRENEVEPETSAPAGLRESWARVADFHLQKLRRFYDFSIFSSALLAWDLVLGRVELERCSKIRLSSREG